MLKCTTQTGAGAGTALITAGAAQRLRVGEYVYLQLMETGTITAVLKFDSTAIHSPILLDQNCRRCYLLQRTLRGAGGGSVGGNGGTGVALADSSCYHSEMDFSR